MCFYRNLSLFTFSLLYCNFTWFTFSLTLFLVQWLNNCVGRKNYYTFVCLMAVSLVWVSYLLSNLFDICMWLVIQRCIVFLCQLTFECGVGIAVLVRCFVNKKATENQIADRLGDGFSRPPFATVVVRSFYPHNHCIVIFGQFHALTNSNNFFRLRCLTNY